MWTDPESEDTSVGHFRGVVPAQSQWLHSAHAAQYLT